MIFIFKNDFCFKKAYLRGVYGGLAISEIYGFKGGFGPNGCWTPPSPLKEKNFAPSWQIAEYAPIFTDLTDLVIF